MEKLVRRSQTWALALESAFADPANPTTAELNNAAFVHFISCALVEDGTEMVRGDSETDDEVTFCSIGNESTPTNANITATLVWRKDANTGGSGSTVDLTSLYNKVTAMLDYQDIPYWLISRTGPQGNQDDAFAIGDVIKMAKFNTDYPVDSLANNSSVKGSQTLLFQGSSNWNYHVTA